MKPEELLTDALLREHAKTELQREREIAAIEVAIDSLEAASSGQAAPTGEQPSNKPWAIAAALLVSAIGMGTWIYSEKTDSQDLIAEHRVVPEPAPTEKAAEAQLPKMMSAEVDSPPAPIAGAALADPFIGDGMEGKLPPVAARDSQRAPAGSLQLQELADLGPSRSSTEALEQTLGYQVSYLQPSLRILDDVFYFGGDLYNDTSSLEGLIQSSTLTEEYTRRARLDSQFGSKSESLPSINELVERFLHGNSSPYDVEP